MIAKLADTLQIMVQSFQLNVVYLLIFLGILWGVQFVNVLLQYRLNCLGIYPRKPWGLLGVVFSPFLHGDFNHLLFNSIPLFVLSNFMLVPGLTFFYHITGFIILVSGVGTWLFGRPALHVGASSLIMGYFSYLLFNAYRAPTMLSLVLAAMCLYYFGALFFSLLPTDRSTSFEGHIAGFIAGGLASLIWV